MTENARKQNEGSHYRAIMEELRLIREKVEEIEQLLEESDMIDGDASDWSGRDLEEDLDEADREEETHFARYGR